MAEAGISLHQKKSSDKMPVLFLGHGSPMNALADNAFTRGLHQVGQSFTMPSAVLCVSAHWMTRGTWVTHMEKPRTIHDFGGFPKELFAVQYPALGNPQLSEDLHRLIQNPIIHLDDDSWGLDHGTWSVLKHLYPKADIPVIQLSLDLSRPLEYHADLGRQLAQWRQQGVLIVGSGNIVHNLKLLDWDEGAKPFDWALEFDEAVKDCLIQRNFKALEGDLLKTEAGKLSVPTIDHFAPLLYALGASDEEDEISFLNEGTQHASISMTCIKFATR